MTLYNTTTLLTLLILPLLLLTLQYRKLVKGNFGGSAGASAAATQRPAARQELDLCGLGHQVRNKPCKEIGTPSLKAVGEQKVFFILPPWPWRKKAPAEKYSVEDVIPTTM